MVDENYSSFTKTGPNKGNSQPDEPENHRKERKEGAKARARKKKKTSNSLQNDKIPVPKNELR